MEEEKKRPRIFYGWWIMLGADQAATKEGTSRPYLIVVCCAGSLISVKTDTGA